MGENPNHADFYLHANLCSPVFRAPLSCPDRLPLPFPLTALLLSLHLLTPSTPAPHLPGHDQAVSIFLTPQIKDSTRQQFSYVSVPASEHRMCTLCSFVPSGPAAWALLPSLTRSSGAFLWGPAFLLHSQPLLRFPLSFPISTCSQIPCPQSTSSLYSV